jgi:hypothetical protein
MPIILEPTAPIIPVSRQINPKQILDRIMERIHDNSTVMRSRILGYLNFVLESLVVERDWLCLQVDYDTTEVDGVVAHPADYSKCLIIAGEDFTYTTANRIFNPNGNDLSLVGWADYDNYIKVFTTVSTEISLRYVKAVETVIDDTTTLPFPKEFMPYLIRATLSSYYEYDDDQRFMSSAIMASGLLKTLKIWDNNQQAMPSTSKYLR